MSSFQDILTAQPHHVSGYTGFVPGYITCFGQSYGRTTHGLFFDRTVKRSNVPVLNDLSKFYDEQFITPEERDLINERCKKTQNCKYTTDILPGYGGYVPQYHFLCGKKYSIDTTKGLNNFVKIQELSSRELDNKIVPDVLHSENKYTHPFNKDFEAEELFKEQYTKTVPIPPTDTIYFLENGNPHKKFMAGYAGHVPNLMFEFGQPYTPSTENALNVFTDEYKKHKLFMH
ncbi:protein FAM166B [Myzus persicae]|uniref:protein FAM166B n=1 Tax=Myzus persicae TaxID=13164 RepID=UPI000B938F03|nr:protein FAM166B [Myzus persicae]